MPAPSPSSSKRVRIVNRERDKKYMQLDELESDGSAKRGAGGKRIRTTIVLGSTDDEGVDKCDPPEVVLDGAVWDRLLKQKAIAGWVNERKIFVHPA